MKRRSILLCATLLAELYASIAHASDPRCPVLPARMKAAVIHAAGGPEALRIESRAVPRATAGEVIVHVRYASVNPVDWKLQRSGGLTYPAVPGGDFSGDVVAVGSGVDEFKCGDAVAGIVDQRQRSGSYAEYVAVPTTEIIAKPRTFSYAQAAAYPTVAVAAHRYLIASAELHAGESVLVQGGAGGVGSVVAQIAKASGALVFATASTRNQAFLQQLGVDVPIDYTRERFEDAAAGVDLVVDTVGGETLSRSASMLKPGARIVSLAGRVAPELCTPERLRCPPPAPWAVGAGLRWVDPLISKRQLRVNIDTVYPLERAADAQRHNMSGHTRGKVVIEMPRSAAIPAASVQGGSDADRARDPERPLR